MATPTKFYVGTTTPTTTTLPQGGLYFNTSNKNIYMNNGGTLVTWSGSNNTYSASTGLSLSGGAFSVKLNSTSSLGTIGTTSKLYAVGVDANGKLCVNVPWTDTNTDTHYTTHLYATGSSGTSHATSATSNPYLRLFDNTTARESIQIKGSGATTVSATNGVITISSTDNNTDTNYYHSPSYTSGLNIATGTGVNAMYVPTGTASQYGVVKPAAVRTSAITSTTGGTTSNRYYGVELDSNGKMFVNVPWTTYTLPAASSSALGGVKLSYNSDNQTLTISV